MAEDKINNDADDQPNTLASASGGGSAPDTGAGESDPNTPDSGEDSVEEEMEIARKHADPSRGDKVVDGGDRVSTDEGGNPQE